MTLCGVDSDEAGWIVVYNAVAPHTELLEDSARLLLTGKLPGHMNSISKHDIERDYWGGGKL